MTDGLKPYQAYKDSGLPWLGKVPAHWGSKRGKVLFRKVARPVRAEDGVITCFRDGVVTLRKNRRLRGFTEAIFELGYQGIRKGDLVIHAMDAFAGAIGVSDSDGKGTPVYAVCQPHSEANSYYYAHLVREMARTQWIQALSRGIRERSTDFRYETFGRQFLPVPPREEQAAIVRYLDHATRKIDQAIRAKRKIIALLNEQKQAIIHRAVTRGLDPDVPLKESGIPWLGQIPAHWDSLRCKYLFREVDSRSPAGEEAHLSMSQKLGLVPSSMIEHRTLISASYAGGKLCEIDDLVLNRLKAHLGVFAVARHSGVISPDYTVLRKRRPMVVAYFEYLLRSSACRGELYIRAKGLVEGFWRLYTDDFYDIRLPVPPASEQERIVLEIAESTRELVVTIDRIERETDLLREYRTRLIADVVTGKLDVRKAAAQLPEPEVEEAPEAIEVEDDEEVLEEAA